MTQDVLMCHVGTPAQAPSNAGRRPPAHLHTHQVQDVMDVHVTGSKVAYPTPREALAAIAARRHGAAAPKAELKAAGTAVQQRGSSGSHQQLGIEKEEPEQEDQGPKRQQQARSGRKEGAPGPSTAQPEASGGGFNGRGSGGCGDGGGADNGVGARADESCAAACESAVVTVRFLGYHRVAHGTGEIIDSVELFLPDSQWETQVRGVRACGVWQVCLGRGGCVGKARGVPEGDLV
jgi:hypothetical protein